MNTVAITMGDIRKATLLARQRTGCNGIGTQVKQGRLQVVNVTFPVERKGRSTVTPLSDYLAPVDALQFLNMVQN